jgi:uncharacterized delta-60 repeat protein
VRRSFVVWSVASAFVVAFATPARAGGQLDATFGLGGRVTTDFFEHLDSAQAVAIQKDDKIVLAGYANSDTATAFGLVRYLPDGALDTSFGDGGKAWVGEGVVNVAYAVAVQPNGKIVVAGSALGDFGVARLDSDGTLDQSFGTNGLVTTSFSSYPASDEAHGVAIQSDGKILVAGCADCNSGVQGADDFGLVRYTPDGTLDSTFGSGGLARTDFGSGTDSADALMVQHDGRIVVAGSTNGLQLAFALARYDPNGVLDGSFGTAGQVTTDIGSGGEAVSVLRQPSGKILVAGFTVMGQYERFALVRYRSDGSLDPTFGPPANPGRVITGFGPRNAFAGGAAIQTDRKIVVSGWGDAVEPMIGTDALLARFSPAGKLDSTFGQGGRVRVCFKQGSDFDLGIQSTGKLVIAGTVGDFQGHFDFAAARFLP